ncbi:hypothetical protein [Clostridium pasteurianum]|uniref:Uncharacterized protein n=1 Tax=Clostridium pasteurianum BC1 TaxID=86416 RepID=R4KA50_CLOPA|nr:hypothetical protein [Clostridium pasteurianum]AGK97424.1 hypothetical protein Clopa_2564 [Clostridium pasteurianum BC1]
MLSQTVINEIIIPIIGAGVATILEIGRRQVKAFLDSKQDLINKQKEAIKQTMGIELYNKDVAIIKNAVKTVEQLGREFNWAGALKHTKVLELIKNKTGLSDDEIFNIIKGTVLEVNSLKSNSIIQK